VNYSVTPAAQRRWSGRDPSTRRSSPHGRCPAVSVVRSRRLQASRQAARRVGAGLACGRPYNPPTPPRGSRKSRQSRRRRPDRSARRPQRAGQWQRGGAVSGRQAAPGLGGVPPSASVSPSLSPPQGGALELAALLAVRHLLGLQPCGLPLPARAATSAPPRRGPPSSHDQTTRSTSPGSVAPASPPKGLGKRWQPAALRSARCVLSIPPPALAIPVGRLRPYGPPQHPWWARHPFAPEGGSLMPLKQAICSTGTNAAR
jgi:hypothetical protein